TIVTNKSQKIADADGIVLPGVGAFKTAMNSLGNGTKIIKNAAAEGKPILGICLGAQLFADWSEENGKTKGLGLIPGEIIKLPKKVKKPHMGWNSIKRKQKHPFLEGIKSGNHAYFVHSYYFKPAKNGVIATTKYGIEIPAIIGKNNIIGTQFHPEKSGSIGLKMIKNFVKMTKKHSQK
ncbi:MAG: imidazole glycerol phosphate synthase subunit HisH, partial [Hadesarchaea archaeon]|nr:imidazole glycerol phosphate synthase subunit HisH [Hadesarchaea archaeon]